MRYGQIRKYDVANGSGVRTSIFVTGCTHNCYNCFNREYQDFLAGDLWTEAETQELISYLNLSNIKGLSILGGEPMENEKDLLNIVRQVKSQVDKDIWLWSGYKFEEIIEDESKLELLKEIDILVDGKYIEKLKNLNLKFRGSSNQRIIDVKKSLELGQATIYME